MEAIPFAYSLGLRGVSVLKEYLVLSPMATFLAFHPARADGPSTSNLSFQLGLGFRAFGRPTQHRGGSGGLS